MLIGSHGSRECNSQLIRLPRGNTFHVLKKHEYLDDAEEMCCGVTFCDIEFDQPAQTAKRTSRLLCPKCVREMQAQGKLLTFN